MREQMERRLAELRRELEVGEQALGELESRGASLRASLLRIGGAAQVLEELLADAAPADASAEQVVERPLRRAAAG